MTKNDVNFTRAGINRRSFVTRVAGTAAALAAGGGVVVPTTVHAAETSQAAPAGDSFPKDFWWGAATAAYQVEGAAREDGRKPSIWDTYSHKRGKIKENGNGDVSTDHYHRYKDDVKLMAELGVKHYRFSIAWPRIIPDGRGAVNEKGVDFYRRLADTLLEHGITPHATLYHWDLPQTLQDRYGGWQSREVVDDFASYATETVKRLGDRITHWMTLNEIATFCYFFQGIGKPADAAPGVALKSAKQRWQGVHHALLAHGRACQAIRAASRGKCNVSIAENFRLYVPVIETPEHIEAARRAFVQEDLNGAIIVPLLTGRYNDQWLARQGGDAPDIAPGDMATIAQPLDSLGFNCYNGDYVRAADNDRGYELLPPAQSYPKIGMPWLNLLPECLYWGVRMISDALGKKDLPIAITENGCADTVPPNAQGEVMDLDRILFLRAYLRNAQRAVSEGYPLIGYFPWSLLDNFEWSWGYTRRFGLTYVDYKTQKRVPKQSFRWYQQVIRANKVL